MLVRPVWVGHRIRGSASEGLRSLERQEVFLLGQRG